MGQHTTAHHYVVMSYIMPILEYLQGQSCDLAPYLRQLNCDVFDLNNADLRVACQDVVELYSLAAHELEDANVGLHMGQSMQFQHLGVLGLLVLCCQRVEEVLQLHTRYQSLLGNGVLTDYTTTKEGLLCMCIQAQDPVQSRQSYEYNLGAWARMRTILLGDSVKAERIELPYPRPTNDSELTQLLGTKPTYNADCVRVFFDANYANLPLMGTDPNLKKMLENQAMQQLRQLQSAHGHHDSMIMQLRKLLVTKLPFGPPSIETIAPNLDLSVRQLQRRLTLQNLNYKSILDELRRELAHQYISNKELTLVDVALMLGFTEQSSFGRAFKRWYGISPGCYRRLRDDA